MLLPPLREKGDVREQVDRGLEDIERVIAAKIVKAVPRVAALNVAAIAIFCVVTKSYAKCLLIPSILRN